MGIPAPGTYPDIRDIAERVGRGLMQLCALTHQIVLRDLGGQRIDTLADLAVIDEAVLDVGDDAAPVLAQVGDQAGNVWAWFRFSLEQPSATCIQPASVPEDAPGRWHRQSLPSLACCGATRYLAHVEYLVDQVSNRDLWNCCRGKTPALFISPTGDAPVERSQTQAIHEIVMEYRLRIMSANWRGGVSARMTPPLSVEVQSDPGTLRIIGDLRRLFIHDITIRHLLGVTKISIGGYRPVYEKSRERILVDAMTLRVVTYTHTPNTPCEIIEGWRMWMQMQDILGRNVGPLNDLSAPVNP